MASSWEISAAWRAGQGVDAGGVRGLGRWTWAGAGAPVSHRGATHWLMAREYAAHNHRATSDIDISGSWCCAALNYATRQSPLVILWRWWEIKQLLFARPLRKARASRGVGGWVDGALRHICSTSAHYWLAATFSEKTSMSSRTWRLLKSVFLRTHNS